MYIIPKNQKPITKHQPLELHTHKADKNRFIIKRILDHLLWFVKGYNQ